MEVLLLEDVEEAVLVMDVVVSGRKQRLVTTFPRLFLGPAAAVPRVLIHSASAPQTF